jgi:hypothetical protein
MTRYKTFNLVVHSNVHMYVSWVKFNNVVTYVGPPSKDFCLNTSVTYVF